MADTGIFQTLASAGVNPLAAVLSNVEVRTAYTPPSRYSAADLWTGATMDTPPDWLGARLKPTIRVETPYGVKVIAPYGEASATEWKANTIQLAVLAGGVGLLVFALGALVGRWGAKR